MTHRWSGCKDEHVFARDIIQEPGLVLIASFSARRVCIQASARIILPPVFAPRVVPLYDLPGEAGATFDAFAEQMADDGFAFLHARIREQPVGPVLTVQRDGKIARLPRRLPARPST